MVWHGMFRVVPFAFSVEKSTPDGKKYASGAGALVTNHSYAPVALHNSGGRFTTTEKKWLSLRTVEPQWPSAGG